MSSKLDGADVASPVRARLTELIAGGAIPPDPAARIYQRTAREQRIMRISRHSIILQSAQIWIQIRLITSFFAAQCGGWLERAAGV
jgi:hypothetical protein